MARPRGFDETRVLEAAGDCFRLRGLAATSVRDLAAGMGISGPSLYNAFGDKRALFASALEHYADVSMRERIDRLERGAPKAAMAAFFAELIERSLADGDHCGCLIVNSAVELAPDDTELRRLVTGYFAEIEAFFRRCLDRARAGGELADAVDCADTARLLVGLVVGLRVMARANPDAELLRGMVRPALAMLDEPAEAHMKGCP